ncbi:MAG: hypothetical protein IKQ87_03215 [Clostridia bacterium]|nr:hypothetical protein [Clostridia bacterium]
MRKLLSILLILALLAGLTPVLSSCARDPGEVVTQTAESVMNALHLADKVNFHTESWYFAENRVFEQYDMAKEMGITFERVSDIEADEDAETLWQPEPVPEDVPEPNITEPGNGGFLMRVYDSMTLYASPDDASAVKDTLSAGTIVELREQKDSPWAEVFSESGESLGYAKDGFLHAIDRDCGVYATLPIEYGQAKTNQETYVQAYSHLVDIRQYFNTVETYAEDFSDLDLSDVDFVVSMKLSTDDTSIGEPFYHRNLCLLQYDLLPMMKAAAERFKRDGYTIIIYDAYRPTSVQQRWFDVIRVHKWVADPKIGMGGVHDRGTAVDISLIDSAGHLCEMPTPMHTFTEASDRRSTLMTATARANMDYMLGVMLECGFTYIQSEWWHFQDVNTLYYLPTDHPIDDIPLAVFEN